MNKYKKYHTDLMYKLLIACCFIIFTSCGILDEDDDYFNGTMEAKVNEKLIIFEEVYGDRVLGDDGNWSKTTKIIGKTDINISGYEIQIDFPFSPVKGTTYHLDCMHRTWIGKYYDYNQTGYITKAINSDHSEFSSSLVFTSITDKSYKGTFSFTAYDNTQNPTDSVVVKDGKFEIASSGKKW